MKIEAKLKDAVPDPEPSQVEACARLSTAMGQELLTLLQAMPRSPWERDRLEPHMWVPVLDHFDIILTAHLDQIRMLPSSINKAAAVDAVGAVSSELVIEILRVSEIMLLLSEKLRRVYGSVELVSALLDSEDLRVVQASVHLLRLLLKRGRPTCNELHRRLAQLAAAWSPFEPRLTLLQACTEPPPQTTVHTFEYRAGTTVTGAHRMETVQISSSSLLNTPLAELVSQIIQDQQLPEAGRGDLQHKLRMVRAMATVDGRRRLLIIRVLAMSVMLQTAASFQKYLSAYPGLLSELVDMLRNLPDLDASIVDAVCAATGALVRERSPHQRQLSQFLQLGAPHGLVGSLLRATLAPRRGGVTFMSPPAVEAVLEFFLCCVGVNNTVALGHAGIISCLLESTSQEALERLPSVCLAYRVIEAVIDVINGAAATLFRDLNGQSVLAQRLSVALEAISKHPPVPEEDAVAGASSETLTRCWQARRTLTALRGNVGAILRCILAGLRAEATRGPGVLRGPLTPLVKNLLEHPTDVGASAFSGAASILAHLIGDDPSCVGALIEAGVIPAFLEAVSKTPTLLRSAEVFQITVTVLGAVHLHDAGEKEVRERTKPHLFEVMVSMLIDPVAFRTLGASAELHSALGGTLDEVASNRPSTRPAVLEFADKALAKLLEQARSYPSWTPRATGASAPPPSDAMEQYPDRLAAMGRFLEALLAQAETAASFAQLGGAAKLVDALTVSCLPPHFLQTAPGHPTAVVFRAIANVSRESAAKLAGFDEKFAALQAFGPLPEAPVSELPAAAASDLMRRLAGVSTVLAVHSASHRDIVTPGILTAAADAVEALTPTIAWLFKQIAAMGPPPPDHYSDTSVFRDPSMDFTALARDAYLNALQKDAKDGDAGATSEGYSPSVIKEMMWRALFAIRHFLVNMVGRQLSLPARRPQRVFITQSVKAAAARKAANALSGLSQTLLSSALGAAADMRPSLAKLRSLAETLDLLHRQHIDEKHHHVRILCMDYLSRGAFFSSEGPMVKCAEFIRESLREAAQTGDVELSKLAVGCMESFTHYVEKFSSFKWIRSAPAPPTVITEREGVEAQSAQLPNAPGAAGGGARGGEAGSRGGDTPMPQAGESGGQSGGGQQSSSDSDAVDPWTLWASLAVSGARSMLVFWVEKDEAVVRKYSAKAMQSLVRTFLNCFDNAEGKPAGESGNAGSAGQGGGGAVPWGPGNPPGSSPQSERLVTQLVDMGFPRRRVELALWHTGNSSIEYAMEWLVTHPEGETVGLGAGEAGGAGGEGAVARQSVVSNKHDDKASLKAMAEVQQDLRKSLVPGLTFLGAHCGDGTPLVELSAQFVHIPLVLCSRAQLQPDGSMRQEELQDSDATKIGVANWRVLFKTMMTDLQEMMGKFPPENSIWECPANGQQFEVVAAHGGAAFTLGVLAMLLHKRPLMVATIESSEADLLGTVVNIASEMLNRVIAKREATLPGSCAEAFSQGYNFVNGNLLLPSPVKEELSAQTQPPRWFDAAFVVLHEAVQQMWLTSPSNLAQLSPSPPVLDAAIQAALVKVALDFICLFPKAEGNAVMASLLLLRELSSVQANASALSSYPRAGLAVGRSGQLILAAGGGLHVLLRLPRHARFPGLLRLVSDICGQLVEDDAFRAQNIEDAIVKMCEGGKPISMTTVVEKMRGHIRSSPALFEQVLTACCCVKPAREGSTDSAEAPKAELVLAPGRKQSRPQLTRSEIPSAHLKVLQQLLDHLLWAIAMESAHEKHITSTSSTAVASATTGTPGAQESAGQATSSSPTDQNASAPQVDGSRQERGAAQGDDKDRGQDKDAAALTSQHPLALPADSVLFVLQQVLVCYPSCAMALSSTTVSQGSASSSSAMAVEPDEGAWAPLPERPSDLPAEAVHIPGKALPSCSSFKTPLAFMLRRVLATGFFSGDPSAATLATLGKVASVLGAVASKHPETRSKVLHEAVSLLKQLANHVESNSGVAVAIGPLEQRPGSGRKVSAPRSARRATTPS